MHIDFQVVDLKQAIQSEVSIELLGAEESPGVKEGGVLEHITHSINVEALPTDIPESIAVDVSGMFIGDTLQLDSVVAPEGVEWALGEGTDPGEITIATLNPPRVEEEPEVEEETELIGEDGEPIEAPEGEEAEGDTPRTPATPATRTATTPTGSSPVHLPPAPRDDAGESDGGARIASSWSGSATPASATRRRATTSASRSSPSLRRRWDLPRAKEKFRGLLTEGASGPAGRASPRSCRRRS